MEASSRKYKWRVVFLGNVVVDQFHDEATFRDMGGSPDKVANAAEFYGCLLGHAVDIAGGGAGVCTS